MKRIVGLFMCMLLITTTIPLIVSAGDQDHPEIADTVGDARAYLDVKKVWFYEDPSSPEMLYTTIELTKPNIIPFKQHLVVLWQMKGEYYASMLVIGYNLTQWLEFYSIIGRGQLGDPQPTSAAIKGTFDIANGTVTCVIPKSTIGNPAPGDMLTNTHSECFQRFRFWGRLGFAPFLRDYIFDKLLKKWQLEDFAPDSGYGSDYIIQY
jgi:hypothetical protein